MMTAEMGKLHAGEGLGVVLGSVRTATFCTGVVTDIYSYPLASHSYPTAIEGRLLHNSAIVA